MSNDDAPQRGASSGLQRSATSAYLAHHRQSAIGSLRRLGRAPVSSLMTLLVLAIALALPSGLYVLLENVRQVTVGFESGSQISIYLNTRVSDAEASRLAADLRVNPKLAQVQLIDRAQALEEFQAISGWGDVLSTLDRNPLPAVVVVKPVPAHAGPNAIEALAEELSSGVHVESVQIDLQWLKRLQAFYDLVGRAVLTLALLLGLAMLLIIGNTIRLAIESRREEIVVVKLVGGTDAYVSRPFLYTGFWYGVISALLAWLMVSLALAWLEPAVNRLSELYFSRFHLSGLSLLDAIVLLGVGAFLGCGGAWLAVRRHLGIIEPS